MIDSIYILLIGSIYGIVNMKRRLRQGDPISPYMFRFSELLSHMMLKLKAEGKIQKVKFGISAPAISHLIFTDDIFC